MDVRRRISFNMNTGSGEPTEPSTGTYTINLNGQWEATTAVPNPDSTLYDGVYRSSSSYNVNNGVSIMYITIKDCSSFKMYIRSYAESNYDYVMVSQLDKTITGSSSYSDTTLVKAHTRGNQQSGTALSNYTLVEFTGITSGEHTITVVYRKDSSVNNGDDRGYVLIEKSQAGSGEGGGDIEIDTTYAIYYTSSDGNIVTPYATDVFGANIISNNYIDGQGIISFDGLITTIGVSAFANCHSLTSVIIPDSVTEIGMWAFNYCTSLTSVTIGNGVTSIGMRAFLECSNIQEFNGKFASEDGRCLIIDGTLNSFAIGCGATEYTIPDSVTVIGDYAFYHCTTLATITIPESVTTIGNSAFSGCSSLTSITIPDSVTSIGNYAFYGCSLTSVTIPDSVTTIGDEAFGWCKSLTSVYCKAITPPAGYYSMFYNNASGRKIYVPMESVEAYKSEGGWSEYKSYIVGYNF